MVSVAASGNTSWVCDPSLVSYELEQPEMLRSYDYKHSNVMHNFSVHSLYNIYSTSNHDDLFIDWRDCVPSVCPQCSCIQSRRLINNSQLS